MGLPAESIPLLAGSIAGLVEHLTIYPVDTMKTRLQSLSVRKALSALSSSPLSTMRTSYSNYGGVRGLYSGMSSMVISAPLAHGVHFGVYEAVQSRLTSLNNETETQRQVNTIIASVAAASLHDLISTPFDVVKQRLQVRLQFAALAFARAPHPTPDPTVPRPLQRLSAHRSRRRLRFSLPLVPHHAAHVHPVQRRAVADL